MCGGVGGYRHILKCNLWQSDGWGGVVFDDKLMPKIEPKLMLLFPFYAGILREGFTQ